MAKEQLAIPLLDPVLGPAEEKQEQPKEVQKEKCCEMPNINSHSIVSSLCTAFWFMLNSIFGYDNKFTKVLSAILLAESGVDKFKNKKTKTQEYSNYANMFFSAASLVASIAAPEAAPELETLMYILLALSRFFSGLSNLSECNKLESLHLPYSIAEAFSLILLNSNDSIIKKTGTGLGFISGIFEATVGLAEVCAKPEFLPKEETQHQSSPSV